LAAAVSAYRGAVSKYESSLPVIDSLTSRADSLALRVEAFEAKADSSSRRLDAVEAKANGDIARARAEVDAMKTPARISDSLCREAKKIIDGVYRKTTGATALEKSSDFSNRLNTEAYPILESWRKKYSPAIMESVEYVWSKASLDYETEFTNQWLEEMKAGK